MIFYYGDFTSECELIDNMDNLSQRPIIVELDVKIPFGLYQNIIKESDNFNFTIKNNIYNFVSIKSKIHDVEFFSDYNLACFKIIISENRILSKSEERLFKINKLLN